MVRLPVQPGRARTSSPACGDAAHIEPEAGVGGEPLRQHSCQNRDPGVHVVVHLDPPFPSRGRSTRPTYWTMRPRNAIGKAMNSVSSGGQSKPSPRRLPVATSTMPSPGLRHRQSADDRRGAPSCRRLPPARMVAPRSPRGGPRSALTCSVHCERTRQLRPALAAAGTSAQICRVRAPSSTRPRNTVWIAGLSSSRRPRPSRDGQSQSDGPAPARRERLPSTPRPSGGGWARSTW